MEEGKEKIWTGRRGRRRSDGRAAVVGDLVHGRLGLGLWWLSLDEGLMSAIGCSHAGRCGPCSIQSSCGGTTDGRCQFPRDLFSGTAAASVRLP